MTRRALVPVVAALVALAACSDGMHAAEPATAPATSTAPAGTVMHVGLNAQGIVYDPQTRLLAVAVQQPDRLLLLNPMTLVPRSTVQLPGSVRHLQLGYGGSSVLVPVESARRILQVSLPDARITTSVTVQKQPHDAAQASNGDILVGNEFGKSLSVVRDGKVVHTFDDLTQPGGVIADGSIVGVVDVGAYTLSTYDLRTLKRTQRVGAGAGPTHGVLVSGNRMLVVDTRGNALRLFDADTLRETSHLALPGTPYGVTVDTQTGLVWITLTARNQVVGVDVSGATPKVIARYATVRQPDTVAVAPGSHRIWVAGTYNGVVQRITR